MKKADFIAQTKTLTKGDRIEVSFILSSYGSLFAEKAKGIFKEVRNDKLFAITTWVRIEKGQYKQTEHLLEITYKRIQEITLYDKEKEKQSNSNE